ncbi:hypothetical protein [Bacillus niameyensis]|uniref:hypothetical protein n=1 Tax=Bacillus niameyensis TaxID=1522308 RepID=UPI00078062B3|nr:hypothetical protein [Bacillus niameyensis]
MDSVLKRYQRDFSHSYTFGVFPTIELMKHKPQMVEKVILNSKGLENAGIGKINDLCKKMRIPIMIND